MMAITGCSASASPGSTGFGGSGGDGNAGGNGLGSGGDGGGLTNPSGTGGSSSNGCSAAEQLVYVVSEETILFSFDPGNLTFTRIGQLNCPANGGTPFSMAVDRHGTAWVLYNGGAIWAVDVTTAACQATTYQAGQSGFRLFGMGFSTNGTGSTDETLYIAKNTGIGKLDTSTFVVTPVGSFDKLGGGDGAELTGTGDGRLFGFFDTSTNQVAEIDKTDSHIVSNQPLPSVNIGDAWAFAFWGGSFYLFTDPSGSGSQVDKYDPSSGQTQTVITDVGQFNGGTPFRIVGAGVSTCAPTTPPK